ncbi:MAG: response regulator transcription factor [Bacteroidota bacterium]
MPTLLIVDDQASVRALLHDYFVACNYTVVLAANGREALSMARHQTPDLVLLDLMMPELDGFDFLRAFRRDHTAPVIISTARNAEADKVAGFKLGADDYVTKPFSLRELEARVEAVLRRTHATTPETVLRVRGLVLDASRHYAEVDGTPVSLTPTEMTLLQTFMAAPGRVFSRAQLLVRLQGDDASGSERTVDVHVRNLRAKIEPEPATPAYIETVFGVGYRLGAA